LLDGATHPRFFVGLPRGGGGKRRVVVNTALWESPSAGLRTHEEEFYFAVGNSVTHCRNMDAIC
jgi:hypothetical protein